MILTKFVKDALIVSIEKELCSHESIMPDKLDECYTTAPLLAKLKYFGLTDKIAVSTSELYNILTLLKTV